MPNSPPEPAPESAPEPVPGPSRLDELTARAQRVIAARAAAAPQRQSLEPGPAPDAAVEDAAVADLTPDPIPEGTGNAATAGGLVSPSTGGAPGGEVVLGIDPGTATTGYGFVRRLGDGDGALEAVAYGVIETPAGDAMPDRLLALYRRLRQLIQEHRPAQAVVEKLFFGRNTTTAIGVGQARGVALLAIAEAGIPVVEYTPAEVKSAMAGFGRADKLQMQRMVQTLLGLPSIPRPDDAADALAIALCHMRLAGMRSLGLR